MRAGLLLVAVVALSGCSSIRTNMWTRAEDESLHLDPCENLKGMPVMLKVPSHIEVKIVEKLYAAHDRDNSRLEVVRLKRPDLMVFADLKYTEKMFLVDPVRAAAGTGEFGFGFAPLTTGQKEIFPDGSLTAGASAGHGYLHSANYKADDQTIAQAGELVKSVLNFNRVTGMGAGNASPGRLNLVTIERVVAFRRFDLAACDCNEQVHAFLETHINQCHCGERSFNLGNEITAPESPAPASSSGSPSGSIVIEFGDPPTPKK